jgi:hypothetical protein
MIPWLGTALLIVSAVRNNHCDNIVSHISDNLIRFISKLKSHSWNYTVANSFSSVTVQNKNLSTWNATTNVRHPWLYEYVVLTMRKILKLSSDNSDSDNNKYRRDYDYAYGGGFAESDRNLSSSEVLTFNAFYENIL